MIIATAGHVDHGKTELIKALTGIDTDRLPEEKARGLSIDLGFAYQHLSEDIALGFVDVPGHEKFIRNMLAGVGGIDLALVVVAADDGVMPQTREHLAILNLLDIQHYLVAITKIDKVDPGRISDVKHQIAMLFDGNSRETPPIFPVSSTHNHGITDLKLALEESAKLISKRPADGYFRMSIDRIFSIKGTGLIATGMVISGKTAIEDRLIVSSRSANNQSIRIRGIRVNKTINTEASAGDRCAINLAGKGIKQSTIQRGDWLLHPALSTPTQRIDLDLKVLPGESRPLKHWTPVHAHIAAGHFKARIAVLSGGSIAPGDRGLVQLVLDADSYAVHGDHIVLRDESAKRTIAGGYVVDPYSPKRGRSRATRLNELKAMNQDSPTKRLRELALIKDTGVSIANFVRANNLQQLQIDSIVDDLGLIRAGSAEEEHVFSPIQWQGLLARTKKCIKDFHAKNPRQSGANLKEIQLMLRPYQRSMVLDNVIQSLLSAEKIVRTGNQFSLPDHLVVISEYDNDLLDRILPFLQPESGSPSSLHQLAENTSIDKRKLETSLKKLVRHGALVYIGKNRYLFKEFVVHFSKLVHSLNANSEAGFTVADFCNQSNLGRNFAIDLLEYFDQQGFTQRKGNMRITIQSVEEVFL